MLAHGYALNHTALALYRGGGGGHAGSGPDPSAHAAWDISEFCAHMAARGFGLNAEGSVVKVGVVGVA